DEDGLAVGGEEIAHLGGELAPVVADALARDALAGTLERRLHEQGEGESGGARIGDRARQPEGRRGHAIALEDLLGAALVKAEAEREGVRGVIGHAEELADGRDVALTARAEEP